MKLFPLLLSLATTALCSRVSLPGYPLAVKTPYLSTWFPGGPDGGDFPHTEPFFWRRNALTWNVVARIDGHSWCLLGCTDNHFDHAEQVDLEFTSTHTYVTLKAGRVQLTLDFFSPVSFTDYIRQSIPYSYLTVSVDHAFPHSTIDIMSAIDDTWTAQTHTELETSHTHKSSIFEISGVDSIPLTELEDMSTYGKIVFAANSKHGAVSSASGDSYDLREQFRRHGTLASSHYGGGGEYQPGDLVAHAYRLKQSSKTRSVTFAVGHERDPAIQWLDEPQSSYYRSEIDNTGDVVDHFFADEVDARKESDEVDARVRNVGRKISDEYADLLEMSIRQIWGGFELTVPADTKDTKKGKAFIKEISTDGNVQTLADLIPKALPAFYVLAPDYIRLMLEPIMEYTLEWPADFAFHDLGKSYPNATGETVEDQEKLIMDQTSVIHWMLLSYQKATGDTDYVKPYLEPLTRYADHLVENGLYPPSERSSVDSIGATPNQTVLAIYAAIGLTAFGELSGEEYYTNKGKEYAPKIVDMGTDSQHTHIKAHYNDTDDSWISTYPFAFDVMLGLDTFNQSTLDRQSKWYEGKIHEYGMQFYDGVDYTVSELSLWCAATSSDKVRDGLIGGIHNLLTNGMNTVVGPTQWNVTGPGQGLWFFSTAKSIIGSYFMPVAVLQELEGK